MIAITKRYHIYSYPLASQDDLSENCDNCAICWEKMETARKLPCGHLFHKYVFFLKKYVKRAF